MIIDTVDGAIERYGNLHPRLRTALEFLLQTDLNTLGNERIILDGDALYASPDLNVGRSRQIAFPENHRRYIDLHCLIEGREEIGWLPAAECRTVYAPYDAARDTEFFTDRPRHWATLLPGEFAAAWPGEAHAPMVGEGFIRKIVVKILVD